MNNNQATINKMSEMRLHGMVNAFRNLLETGQNMDLTTDEVISYLIDSEWDEKHNRRLQRLTRAARFRYQASVVISQQPVSNWCEIIGDPTIADAILDRLVFNSHRI